MDYMDPDVRCPQKAAKLTPWLTCPKFGNIFISKVSSKSAW